MRKITIDASKAFHERGNFKRDNTEVETFINDNGVIETKMSLFGNLIAVIIGANKPMICDGDYPSITTKERLNGLQGVGRELD